MAKKEESSDRPDATIMPLAEGFPSPSDEAWRGMVARIVGDDAERALARSTYDSIPINPLYTAADRRGDKEASGFPGMLPFTRGQHVIATTAGGWDIRQRQTHPDRSAANAAILDDLERGCTSIELQFDKATRSGRLGSDASPGEAMGRSGLMVYSVDDLDELLRGVYLDACPISLRTGAAFVPVAAMMDALLARRKVDCGSFAGAFNADPLGSLAAFGTLPGSVESTLEQLGGFAAFVTDRFPEATAVAVDTTVYHDAGASEAQELACALATGTAYLRSLTAAGLDLDAAFRQIVLTFATDANLFLSIAKLRAARRLWGRVAEACGAAAAARGMRLHATTSARMMSRRDPWVNILRGTIATLAASVAGADSITVLPFTTAIGLPDGAARRIARNTQLVLQQESSLGRVIDPAGGSWAIENITDDVAQKAWQLFQEIEGDGGIVASLGASRLQDRIQVVAGARARRVGALSDPLTGTSAFPDLAEQPVPVEAVNLDRLCAAAADRMERDGIAASACLETVATSDTEALFGAAAECAAANAPLGALLTASARGVAQQVRHLPAERLSEPFEALRDASDAYLDRTGARPTVFLATLGTLAKFTTAVTYARNFLAAGGIDAVQGPEDADTDAIVEAFGASGAAVAVICSSASDVIERAPDLAKALSAAGARDVYIVGRSGTEQPDAAPISAYLHDGCDMPALLREMMTRMEVLSK